MLVVLSDPEYPAALSANTNMIWNSTLYSIIILTNLSHPWMSDKLGQSHFIVCIV